MKQHQSAKIISIDIVFDPHTSSIPNEFDCEISCFIQHVIVKIKQILLIAFTIFSLSLSLALAFACKKFHKHFQTYQKRTERKRRQKSIQFFFVKYLIKQSKCCIRIYNIPSFEFFHIVWACFVLFLSPSFLCNITSFYSVNYLCQFESNHTVL